MSSGGHNTDTWCIPYEYIMENTNENVEQEHKHEEDSSSMDASSSEDSPRSSEDSPTSRKCLMELPQELKQKGGQHDRFDHL